MSGEVKKTNKNSETDGNTEVEEFNFDTVGTETESGEYNFDDFSTSADTADTALVVDDSESRLSNVDLEGFARCFDKNFFPMPPSDANAEKLLCSITKKAWRK